MTDRFRSRRAGALVAVLAAAALAVGCGDEEEPSDGGGQAADPSPSASMEGMEGMDDMGDMMMNDPDAVPASEIAGAVESEFALLETAPPGSDAVAGTAWLAQGDPGTTLTVNLAGLEPGTEFVGHLHAQPCAEDNGGPHFQFDPNGSELPPNEVHIGFAAAEDGTATATITNEQAVGGGARSVVIHPVEAMDNRLVCADF